METYEELEAKMIDAVGREKTEEIRQMGLAIGAGVPVEEALKGDK